MRFRKTWLLIAAATAVMAATRPDSDIAFNKIMLDVGQNEPAAFADINHDGKLDIVSGENWYEAPKWTRHHFRKFLFTGNYIDDFSDLPLDVNGDGNVDIVGCGWFSKSLWWDENPGKTGAGEWKRHDIDSGFNIEFCFLVDLDNDGKKREIIPQFGNIPAPLAWYEVVNGKTVKHVIAAKSEGHGIGVGDINKDGRNDILTPNGWYEAPADPKAGTWTFHADWKLGQTGFIYALDVNADGRPDIVTSMAHDYGVFWLEQPTTPGGVWKKNIIDDSWSQPHAMTMVDLNGDGRMDFVTGKRFMAHNGKDPGEREPLGIYWYEHLAPDEKGNVEWVKHTVDYGGRTGGGMQIPVADIDGDGDLDFAVGGKSGVFLFENLTKRTK